MNSRRTHIASWAALGAGILLLGALAWFMAGQAQDRMRGWAAQQAAGAKQRGFLVWVYDNPFLTGPAKSLVKPAPRMHQPSQGEKQRHHHFAWRWLAALKAPRSGDYILRIHAGEALRLRLDGRLLIERWEGALPRPFERLVRLEAGWHLFDLSNVQSPKRLALSILWAPPGQKWAQPIPSANLRPLKGASARQLSGLYRQADFWRQCIWFLPLVWLALWALVLRDPARAWQSIREHRWFLAVLALAACARLLWAESVPGLSGESAHFMWRAELIWQGAWPFAGMNTRVGPLFDYLLAPLYGVFGPSVWLLRATGAVLNLAALVFCYRVCLREWGLRSALGACLLVAVLPALVAFARMAGDNSSLGPLAFFWGLDLLSLSRRRPVLALWAGLIWGLASFNHGMFAVLPFTLVISAVLVSRLRIMTDPRFYGFGLGLFIGYLPRLISMHLGWVTDQMAFTDHERLAQLGGFIKMFGSSLDGQVVYQIFTGRLVWQTPWVNPALLVISLAWLVWAGLRRRDDKSWSVAWLGLALVIQLGMIPYGAPSANPRYFMFGAFFAALLMGRGLGLALDMAGARLRAGLVAGLLALAAFNLASLGVNYFYGHLDGGGRPLVWGNDLLDHTSDAWMDHGALARELARRGYPVVAAEDYWHHTLDKTLNLYQGRFRRFQAVDRRSRSDTERAAVFYNSPEGRMTLREYLSGNPDKKFKRVLLPPGLNDKYILLERVSPGVSYPPEAGGEP